MYLHNNTWYTVYMYVPFPAQPLADLLEGLQPMLSGVQNNRKEWQSLADDPGTYAMVTMSCTMYMYIYMPVHA